MQPKRSIQVCIGPLDVGDHSTTGDQRIPDSLVIASIVFTGFAGWLRSLGAGHLVTGYWDLWTTREYEIRQLETLYKSRSARTHDIHPRILKTLTRSIAGYARRLFQVSIKQDEITKDFSSAEAVATQIRVRALSWKTSGKSALPNFMQGEGETNSLPAGHSMLFSPRHGFLKIGLVPIVTCASWMN